MEWIPEAYDISREPCLCATFHVKSDHGPSNFPRATKWSPDGTVVLSQCEDRSFQLFDLSSDQGSHESSQPTMKLYPSKVFNQAAPILDFIWFPTATPHDPASFCFVASVRECPVKLLDASDGRLRASYKIVDHRERQIAPHSLAFNLTAQKLYCGIEDAIEVFDLSRPGEGTRIPTTPSKKTKDGLKGIISALAFSPTYSPDESFYAAGTFTPSQNNIAMFSDAQDEPLMYLGGGPRAGVTQLQFNPLKPHILYAGYRGNATGSIYSWDVRSNVDSPFEVLQVPPSPLANRNTNQRMRFDVDFAGRMLSVGSQLGTVSLFKLDGPQDAVDPEDTLFREPALQFKAHEDSVGSTAFHPFGPILMTASGSRHFTETDEDGERESEESDSDSGESRSLKNGHIIRQMKKSQPVCLDSSIKTWDFKTADVS